MSDHESPSSAGLSYAPAYDKSKEFDPKEAEVIPSKEIMRREDFDYFRKRMEKQAAMGRMLLIVVLLIAVGANIWLTLKTQDIVIENVNQARHDQADLDEQVVLQVSALAAKIEALEAQLAAIGDAHPVKDQPAAAE